jgi:hypothetical protein
MLSSDICMGVRWVWNRIGVGRELDESMRAESGSVQTCLNKIFALLGDQRLKFNSGKSVH